MNYKNQSSDKKDFQNQSFLKILLKIVIQINPSYLNVQAKKNAIFANLL